MQPVAPEEDTPDEQAIRRALGALLRLPADSKGVDRLYRVLDELGSEGWGRSWVSMQDHRVKVAGYEATIKDINVPV